MPSGGSISLLLGNGDGTFKNQSEIQFSGYAFNVTMADFNGDGRPRYFSQKNTTIPGLTSVLPGNGDGTFSITIDVFHNTLRSISGNWGREPRWPRRFDHRWSRENETVGVSLSSNANFTGQVCQVRPLPGVLSIARTTPGRERYECHQCRLHSQILSICNGGSIPVILAW